MPRTITVKGVGKASASPDYVTLSIVLESFNENYDSAMDLAEAHIQELTAALVGAGFEKEALKTTNFNVSFTVKATESCGCAAQLEIALIACESRSMLKSNSSFKSWVTT